MADLIKLGNELLEDLPALKPSFFGLSAVLGELTFATRMEKKYTQADLAEHAGVGVKTIHRIEGGSGGITDTTYEKVFFALGLSYKEIAEAFKKKSTESTEKELVTQ